MRIIMLPLLLGHALGDFYFQTSKMAQQKTQRKSSLLLHMLAYAAIMALTLAASIRITPNLALLWGIASGYHCVIDFFKYCIVKTRAENKIAVWLRKYIFFIDQTLHLAVLLALAMCFRGTIIIRLWQVAELRLLAQPMALFTGLAYLLTPASVVVNEFLQITGLRNIVDGMDGSSPLSFSHAGKYIGMLERVLAYVLILSAQFAAIGFLLTAKTITRFKELENREIAEYYLTGTLLSITVAFGIALVCN